MERDKLLGTMDAKVWTDEFMATKARLGDEEFDHAMMLAWFANAIMAGFDEANRCAQRALDAAQARVKELELYLTQERANRDSLAACVDRDVKKIKELQAQLAAAPGLSPETALDPMIEGDIEAWKQAAECSEARLNSVLDQIPTEHISLNETAAITIRGLQAQAEIGTRQIAELQAQLRQAEWDRQTLRQLVSALPVAGLPVEHARSDDFVVLQANGEWMVHTYNYWAKFATEDEARAYIALLEYRASLPAQPAQGGA